MGLLRAPYHLLINFIIPVFYVITRKKMPLRACFLNVALSQGHISL